MMIPTFDSIIEITIITTLGRVQISYENIAFTFYLSKVFEISIHLNLTRDFTIFFVSSYFAKL